MNIILALAMFVLACFTFNALLNQDQIQKPSNKSLLLISAVGMIEFVYSLYSLYQAFKSLTPDHSSQILAIPLLTNNICHLESTFFK